MQRMKHKKLHVHEIRETNMTTVTEHPINSVKLRADFIIIGWLYTRRPLKLSVPPPHRSYNLLLITEPVISYWYLGKLNYRHIKPWLLSAHKACPEQMKSYSKHSFRRIFCFLKLNLRTVISITNQQKKQLT